MINVSMTGKITEDNILKYLLIFLKKKKPTFWENNLYTITCRLLNLHREW